MSGLLEVKVGSPGLVINTSQRDPHWWCWAYRDPGVVLLSGGLVVVTQNIATLQWPKWLVMGSTCFGVCPDFCKIVGDDRLGDDSFVAKYKTGSPSIDTDGFWLHSFDCESRPDSILLPFQAEAQWMKWVFHQADPSKSTTGCRGEGPWLLAKFTSSV